MATIKEIAEIVGVSNSAVSRVLNYDEGISVSDETREAIFATAEKIGYKKRVIYPKIENVALLYFVDHEDELEDVFYHGVKDEIIKQAKKMNIQLSIYDRKDGMDHVPKDLSAFVALKFFRISVIGRRTGEVAKRVDSSAEYPAINGNADESKDGNRKTGERSGQLSETIDGARNRIESYSTSLRKCTYGSGKRRESIAPAITGRGGLSGLR